jgi:hypothetical protein
VENAIFAGDMNWNDTNDGMMPLVCYPSLLCLTRYRSNAELMLINKAFEILVPLSKSCNKPKRAFEGFNGRLE